MKKLFFFTLAFIFTNTILAQNVGIGTTTPNASAILDISANNKGMLIPRVSLLSATDVVTIPSPPVSLLVCNINSAGSGTLAVTPGYYYWNSYRWVPFVVSDNSLEAAWLLGGNSGTSPANNFIGTTDIQPLLFKVRNANVGFLDFSGNAFFGKNSGNINTPGYSNVAIGNAAMLQMTGRSNLVAVGDSALYNNGVGASLAVEATGNTAIGSKALFSNDKGYYNTALGLKTLYSNTSGSYNTANGVQSLFANTSGSYNSATGYQALTNNTNGSNNTAAGFQSLLSNTTGTNNTANGASSLVLTNTGANNTANGYLALFGNTAGNNNTASGASALISNTTGYSNVAVGINALYSNTTSSNTVAVGDSALYNNGAGATITQGKENTAVGSKALISNTTGNGNTAVGANADVTAANLNNATAVGNKSFVNCSNCMVLGSVNGINGAASSVKVGIGTPTPLMGLHVAKTDSAVALFENTQALNLNVSNAMYFKTGSGAAPYTGAIKTIGESANAARLGLYTYASTSPNQLLERLSISDNGYVGMGVTSPLMKLHIVKSDSALVLLENTQTLNTNISNAIYFKTGNALLSYTGAIKTIGENTGAARLGLFTSTAFTANQLLERLSITDNGYVGVGTTTPSMKFHVSKTDSAVALFENTQFLNTNVSTALYFKTGSGSLPYTGAMKTIGESTGAARIGFFTFTSATANGLKERMSITDAGNVGIGATVPQTDLHINPAGAGSLLIGANKFTGLFTNIEMGITAQSNGYGYIQATKSSGSSYGTLAINESGGNVGIGTSQPDATAKLTVGVNAGVGGNYAGIVTNANGNANNAAIKAVGTNGALAVAIDGPIKVVNTNDRVIYTMSTQTTTPNADGYLVDDYTALPGNPDGLVSILINNPLCNGDPNAIIFFTFHGYYENNRNYHPYVTYNTVSQRWFVQYHYDNYVGGATNYSPKLNIMIVKQ